MQNPSATPLPQILTYIWNSPANEMQLNIIEVPGHMAKNRYWPISSMTSLFSYLIKCLFRKGMGVYKSCPRRSKGWKGSCCVNYLPWISPLNTWLFPARVASHSTDDRRISEREITTCFISGRKMGSSSTQCFASMAITKHNRRPSTVSHCNTKCCLVLWDVISKFMELVIFFTLTILHYEKLWKKIQHFLN